jgi:glycyl-tRNA synthetase alpha chain
MNEQLSHIRSSPTFQDTLNKLSVFWIKRGCLIGVPFDVEMGAATFHPLTITTVLKQKPSSVAFMQPCRRPQDARGGHNPNRLYKHHQFQVIIMPPPKNIQQLVLHSLYECGITPDLHNICFVENNWNSPSLGAAGKGYEVQCNGTEVLQFTYFQQLGGIELDLIPIELAYGIERLCLVAQDKEHIYDAIWESHPHQDIHYGEVNDEFEASHVIAKYSTKSLYSLLFEYEQLCSNLLESNNVLAAYEAFLKMSHTFNLLESAGYLGMNDRVSILNKVRNCANLCIRGYLHCG